MRPLSVDEALSKMNANRREAKEKGTAGEEAVLALLQSQVEINKGFIYHSYTYPYAQNRHGIYYPGNILYENGKFVEYEGKSGVSDEIDLVYVTPLRIFSIEVKARAGNWQIFDHWAKQNGRVVDKSPLAQAEKHARHLYHQIYEYLPDGSKQYIVPMVVFVDKAKVEDSRSPVSKSWVVVCVLNNLKAKLSVYDTPLKKSLDIDAIQNRMRSIGFGELYK